MPLKVLFVIQYSNVTEINITQTQSVITPQSTCQFCIHVSITREINKTTAHNLSSCMFHIKCVAKFSTELLANSVPQSVPFNVGVSSADKLSFARILQTYKKHVSNALREAESMVSK
jgi:hypothetical protein